VADQLLDTVRIRVAARALAIEKLEVGEGKALITFAPSTPIDPQRLVQAIQRSRGRMRLRREFTVEAAVVRGPWPALRDSVLRLIEELAAA
jgi:transcription-repair coupling factor (superfamily II helicase)